MTTCYGQIVDVLNTLTAHQFTIKNIDRYSQNTPFSLLEASA
ncbi:hypothetical protein KKH3_41580 [Pectobacterium actinidiae]|nr:hypothetical protein KKH3_41580 [Pectobacterium actinidiae]